MSKTVLALDVGERRIGVAIASLDARLPTPLLTIDRNQPMDVYEQIKLLVIKHDTETIVVGLPRGMNAQETAQTRLSRQFAEELKKRLGINIDLQEEAGTSLEAEEELKAKNQPYNKGDIDKLAATLILQDWLSGATVEQL
jgi:putative holliday junction resolvase